jgi:hypothetical protein
MMFYELFGFPFGGPPGPSLYTMRVVDFREDQRLLEAWGQIWRREFHWQAEWGYEHAVLSGKHPTPEAANAEARRFALEAGYVAPRWFEFWRWSEDPLPPASSS